MKTAIIIQARMGSTRLAGKVMKTILGKTLLELQLERLSRCQEADGILVATTVKPDDDRIVALCQELKVPYSRGSESDVLSRYHEAAVQIGATTVVRMTSDCPLADPRVTDEVIRHYREHPEFGFVTNSPEESRGQTRTFPRGTDVEVFSAKALAEATTEALSDDEREHVTPFLRRHPERYPPHLCQDHADHSQYRLTVDTPEDFELVRRIYEALYPKNPRFSIADVYALLEKNPEWLKINEHVQQKTH